MPNKRMLLQSFIFSPLLPYLFPHCLVPLHITKISPALHRRRYWYLWLSFSYYFFYNSSQRSNWMFVKVLIIGAFQGTSQVVHHHHQQQRLVWSPSSQASAGDERETAKHHNSSLFLMLDTEFFAFTTIDQD